MPNPTSRTWLRRWLCAGAAAATLALAGCAATPAGSDAAQARPGVTVYGTVDAGVGRSRR